MARRYQRPGATAGNVTGTDDDAEAPGSSGATACGAAREALADRYHAVDEAGAAPAPMFFVVSVRVRVAPDDARDGADTADTTRSGPTFRRMYRVLFVSDVSGTALAASAL